MAPRKKPAASTLDAPTERRGWASQVAPDLLLTAKSALSRAGFTDPALILNWAEVAGADTARLCRPLRLSQGAQGGVLTLLAEPAAAVFLQHESRTLCNRINAYFGHPLVMRLRFVQAPLAQRPPPPKPPKVPAEIAPSDPARGFVGPDAIREALLRLARARHTRTG